MAVTSKLFGNFLVQAFNEEHDLNAQDTIKCMLTTSSYTPDQDNHDYKDDVTNECAASGNYSAGGATCTNGAVTYTAGTDVIKFDADDASWASSTITARTAVVYNATGGGADASRGLICYHQDSADVSSSSGTFTVAFDSSGIFTIDVS